MFQTDIELITFEEFLEWKPENKRYELHNGGIVEMSQPVGENEEVIVFLASDLTAEFRSLKLPYFILAEISHKNQYLSS